MASADAPQRQNRRRRACDKALKASKRCGAGMPSSTAALSPAMAVFRSSRVAPCSSRASSFWAAASQPVESMGKNFTEQLVLGELLAQVLEGFCRQPVERRFYLAGTYICHQALLAGRIDMYVEYTGTALAAILKEHPSGDPQSVYQQVKDAYKQKFNLDIMPPLGFNNSFAMVMRGDDARRLKVTTLSQLASVAPNLRLGVGYEFLERQDGYKGLVTTYGLKFAEAPRVMDLGLLYRALQNKSVDVVAGNNTDGLIAALGFVVLDDDKRYFPPY